MSFGTFLRSARLVAPLFLAFVTASDLSATDASGTDFWFAFPQNGLAGSLAVQILAEPGTEGVVEVPGLEISTPFALGEGGEAKIAVSALAELTTGDGIQAVAVRVLADAPVVVHGFNVDAGSADSFLALPISALGTDYFAATYLPLSTFAAGIAIVATADDTEVTVTPTAQIGSHAAGAPYAFTLDVGEAYQGQSANDLSGTKIHATHPVVVLGGDTLAQVPNGTTFADHLVEVLQPTSSWGSDLFLHPSALRSTSERFEIMAGTADTSLTFTPNVPGAPTQLSSPGQTAEAEFSEPTRIQSSHPVSVTHFGVGGENNLTVGDPFQLGLVPVARYAHGYLVGTADDGTLFEDNFVNLVAPAAAVGRIRLDGVRVPSDEFEAIGATGFSEAKLAVEPGAHRLIGPLPYGASIYGFGSYVSYASPAGGWSLPFADGFEEGDLLDWSGAVP